MGIVRQARADSMTARAREAAAEGHTVFLVQLRGSVSHSPSLSRPISGVAEQIEAIEGEGWRLDKFTSVPWKNNMTVVCLFRRQ